MEPRRIRVLLGSGARLSLAGLRELLGKWFAVVEGSTRDLPRLALAVAEQSPDVLVVHLPVEGIEHTAQLVRLRQLRPELGLVLICATDDPPPGLAEMTGVAGVALLTPDSVPETLLHAVTLATQGFTSVCPEWGRSLRAASPAEHANGNDPLRLASPLTPEEVAVLEEIARGQTEAYIARKLNWSVRSVQYYIFRVRDKLGAADRAHAVAIAMKAGLIAGPDPRVLLPAASNGAARPKRTGKAT